MLGLTKIIFIMRSGDQSDQVSKVLTNTISILVLPCWRNLNATPTSNFQQIRWLDQACWYKFTYLMKISADPDQLESSYTNRSESTITKARIFIFFFSYFCSKHRLLVLFRTASTWGSKKYPQSMLWAELRKIMYTPVDPSFTIYVECKGVNCKKPNKQSLRFPCVLCPTVKTQVLKKQFTWNVQYSFLWKLLSKSRFLSLPRKCEVLT